MSKQARFTSMSQPPIHGLTAQFSAENGGSALVRGLVSA